MSLTHLEICKFEIIQGTFVRSADENYITARWCAQSRQFTDFAWLAVHSLEKYMKAILIANDKSSTGYSHRISDILSALEVLCGCELLPTDLLEGVAKRTPVTVKTYVNHLFAVGNPHARYGIFGSGMAWNDLQNLDSLVFAFRRLVCPLDEKVDGALIEKWDVADELERARLNAELPTYRQWLSAHPDEIIGNGFGGYLGDVFKHKDHPLRDTLLNCNLKLAPPDYAHDCNWRAAGGRESVIDRHILGLLQSDDLDTAKLAIDLADWLLRNVELPPGNKGIPGKKQINDAVRQAKTKHGIV